MSLEIVPDVLAPPSRQPNFRRRRLIFWLVLASIPFISMGWAMAYGYSALLGLMLLAYLLIVFGLPVVFLVGAPVAGMMVSTSTGSRLKGWAVGIAIVVLYIGVHIGLRALPYVGPILNQADQKLLSAD